MKCLFCMRIKTEGRTCVTALFTVGADIIRPFFIINNTPPFL